MDIEQVEDNKVSDCLSEIVEVLQKYHFKVNDLLLLYSNLSYTLGASIDGYKEKGPSPDELEKLYYTNPTVGIALMMTGINASVWRETIMNPKEKVIK
jgi:hypothetical protein